MLLPIGAATCLRSQSCSGPKQHVSVLEQKPQEVLPSRPSIGLDDARSGVSFWLKLGVGGGSCRNRGLQDSCVCGGRWAPIANQTPSCLSFKRLRGSEQASIASPWRTSSPLKLPQERGLGDMQGPFLIPVASQRSIGDVASGDTLYPGYVLFGHGAANGAGSDMRIWKGPLETAPTKNPSFQ